jgi:hypothetical protein
MPDPVIPEVKGVEEGTPKAEETPKAEGTSKTPEESLHTIKVGGVERQVTTKEALELASISAGANAKFEEAAEMRKNAARGLRIMELTEAMGNNPSEVDIKEYASIMGVSSEDLMNLNDENNKEKSPGGDPPSAGTISKEALATAMQDMLGISPAEVKGILSYSQKRHVDSARKEIRSTTDLAVEKDEVFGKLLVGDTKDSREEVIKETVAEDVLRRIQDGEPYGTDLVNASIQKIRARFTKFGVPSKPETYPISMGLVPGSGLPTEINSAEPIKRVDASEDKDESNLVARMMQRQIQASRT